MQELDEAGQAKADALRAVVAVCAEIGALRSQLAQAVDRLRPDAVRRAVDAGWSLHGLAEAQERTLAAMGHPAAAVSVETLKADLRVARRS